MDYFVCSDLHLDLLPPHIAGGTLGSLPDTRGIIVAGDLSESACLESWLRALAGRYEQVIYVPGNHDYYGSSFKAMDIRFNELESAIEGLTVLHSGGRTVTRVGDTKLVGATFWYKDPHRAKEVIADPHRIRDWRTQIIQRHKIDYAAIQKGILNTEVDGEECERMVVITHLLPSYQSVAPDYIGHWSNRFFVGPGEQLLEDTVVAGCPAPDLWIHGHTHSPQNYRLGYTRVVCNPLGYLMEGMELSRSLVIDL